MFIEFVSKLYKLINNSFKKKQAFFRKIVIFLKIVKIYYIKMCKTVYYN
jgi:hypothetical protein